MRWMRTIFESMILWCQFRNSVQHVGHTQSLRTIINDRLRHVLFRDESPLLSAENFTKVGQSHTTSLHIKR